MSTPDLPIMIPVPPFDPDFDDCQWTDAWMHIPIIQVVPGVYGSLTVKSWSITQAEVCGRLVRFSAPLEVRGLVMADGRLWMSDVPQERLMMFNNARCSRGQVLVGGLGLGLYPQYVMPTARSLTIVERDEQVQEVIEPVVRLAAQAYGVPMQVVIGHIEETLGCEPSTR